MPHGLAFCGHAGLSGPCDAPCGMACPASAIPSCLQPAFNPFVLSVAQRSRSTGSLPLRGGGSGWGCSGGFFLRGLMRNCSCRGGCPAASYFLVLRQKKVTKEKATRVRRLALRARSPALLDLSGGCATRLLRSLKQCSPTSPDRSALLGGSHGNCRSAKVRGTGAQHRVTSIGNDDCAHAAASHLP